MIAVIDLLLAYAAIRDIQTMEVPLWVSPAGFAAWSVHLAVQWNTQEFLQGLVFAVILFLFLMLNVLFGGLGGADMLIGAMIGYVFSLYSLYAVMIAYFLSIPAALYASRHKQEYPFVPFLAIGAFVVQIWIF